MVSAQDVSRTALALPRTVQRGGERCLAFGVGRMIYLALGLEGRTMGLTFPRRERAGAIARRPDTFYIRAGDERFQWIRVWLDPLSEDEMVALVEDAWSMVAPRRIVNRFRPRG